MTEKEIKIPYIEAQYQELDEQDRQLVDKALEATARAYAPYSKFNVGAAILLDNGEIITGANQENAAFPSGTCAERTACYYAHATYPDARFCAIAVAAVGTDGKELEEPCAPCGACRQALLEYEKLAGRDVRVILVGRKVLYLLPSVKSLVPFAFVEF
ncbi:MAG: cytidine deaminase [Muribaculaceae bacterium]|nr:cytidine deaminase [Muribaculaceae bacterium]MDE6322120.1 cytidine deaminase [Muribaculaceae bacterium]